LPAKNLAADTISGLTVSPATVMPGQNVTVSFSYVGTNTGCKDAILGALSNNSAIQADGTAGQTVLISESGTNVANGAVSGGMISSVNGNNASMPSTNFNSGAALYMTVPAGWAAGTYYAIIVINVCNIYLNPNLSGGTGYSVAFTVSANTPTYTPTATYTPTPLAATKTYFVTQTYNATQTMIAAATQTATAPTPTQTATPLAATQTYYATQTQVAGTATVAATQTQGAATATQAAINNHATQTVVAAATGTAAAATATQAAVNNHATQTVVAAATGTAAAATATQGAINNHATQTAVITQTAVAQTQTMGATQTWGYQTQTAIIAATQTFQALPTPTNRVSGISISPSCYTAGSNITVTFLAWSNAYLTLFCDIEFSGGTTSSYLNDDVYDSGGAENPPHTNTTWNGMSEGSVTSSHWVTITASVMVPASYNSTKNIVITVCDNNMSISSSGINGTSPSTSSAAMNPCGGTASYTPTATLTPTQTLVPTSTLTPTQAPATLTAVAATQTAAGTLTAAASMTAGTGNGNATQTVVAAATQTAVAAATNTAVAMATQTAAAVATGTAMATQTQGAATATAQVKATQTSIAATATASSVYATQTQAAPTATSTLTPTFIATPMGNAWLLPRVDLETSTVSQRTGMTIWSYSNTWLPAGTLVTLKLPASTYLPSTVTAACQCLFVRDTLPSGQYAGEQAVTFTAVTANNTLNFNLPQQMGKGTFYIRLDYTMGVVNPPQPGPATLALNLPGLLGGNMLSSKAYIITPASSVSTLGAITGKVVAYSSTNTKINGRGLAGAMVSAWTSGGNPWPTTWGPRAPQVDAMDTTVNVYSAVSGSDGSFSISVPTNGTTTSYQINAISADNYPVKGTTVSTTYWGTTLTAAVNPGATAAVSLSVTVQ